jgi:superfamily II DNA or RNA helicase
MQKELLKRLGEEVTPVRVVNPKNGKETTIRVKNVELLSGNDDTLRRAAVFKAVKEGICRCLIASTIADEGLDLPILDTLILAGGGKSSTRAFQRVGRVIRLFEGKEKAIVFDFIDYTPMLRRHSRARQKYYQTEPLWDIHKFVVNPD